MSLYKMSFYKSHLSLNLAVIDGQNLRQFGQPDTAPGSIELVRYFSEKILLFITKYKIFVIYNGVCSSYSDHC